jgi:hypothetical protein
MLFIHFTSCAIVITLANELTILSISIGTMYVIIAARVASAFIILIALVAFSIMATLVRACYLAHIRAFSTTIFVFISIFISTLVPNSVIDASLF